MQKTVKICGLKRPEDIEAAILYGAEFLGFIIAAKSPRKLSIDQAAKLSAPARNIAKIIAVTVNPHKALIEDIVKYIRPDFIQLHGDETVGFINNIRLEFGIGIIKAVKIAGIADLAQIKIYENHCDYILLDAAPPPESAQAGGHGTGFDWQILNRLKSKKNLILAGGLSADNIEAAKQTGIGFFDISSGLELSAGVKDHEKIKRFMGKVYE